MANTKISCINGLKSVGYVKNLPICEGELIALLPEGETVRSSEIDSAVKNITYLNKYGYDKDKEGNKVEESSARYFRFNLGRKGKDGKDIFGQFEYNPVRQRFEGVIWGSEDSLKCKLRRSHMFCMGRLFCTTRERGLAFLEDIASNSLPEPWTYPYRKSSINYPILKSFIENTFTRLLHEKESGAENKIIVSQDGRNILFDSNLLDIYTHEILISAQISKQADGEIIYTNPQRVSDVGTKIRLGFKKDAKPEPPMFFNKVEEVIFRPDWLIDKSFKTFDHIIRKRLFRFPESMRSEKPAILAYKLDEAISFAVANARRDYKYIVPMYRPKDDGIQLLMPIYLNRDGYNSKPDFALILTPDKKDEIYKPETILTLEEVYQNARLIARPDEAWLKPDTIL